MYCAAYFRRFGRLVAGKSTTTIVGLVVAAVSCTAFATELEPRSFGIPLPVLSAFFDAQTNTLDEVFISYGSKHEGWAISGLDDRYVKITNRMNEERTYREPPRFEYLISKFEARHINRICNSFVEALEILERDLQRGNWDRCLYLDTYLAPFLRGFHYLMTAARNGSDALPAAALVADTLYEVVPGSAKSRWRIERWQNEAEHTTRLRIASKELVYQIRLWQKEELTVTERDVFARYKNRFAPAYALFVKLYFILP